MLTPALASAVVRPVMPEGERAALAKLMQEEQTARLTRKWQAESETELRQQAGNVVVAFFSTMFNPLDLLFFGFAMWMAFSIASGRRSESA